MKLPRTTLLTAFALATSVALAYDVNKDLRHAGGPPAFDVAVVLSGPETVTGHYDGYNNRRFNSFSNGPSGPNTLLHWQNLVEPGGNGQIDLNEVVHVGWTTADHSSTVKDMYWTDQLGNRIPGSKIYNITSGWTYETSGQLIVDWTNDFVTESGELNPILISDVAIAIAPQPWPLAELNGQNTALNEMMQPIPGATFTVAPGETVSLPIPFPVPPGSAVVLRYGVTGPGDNADAIDWVQFVTPTGLGACCISTSCQGNMPIEQCQAIGGIWYPDQACGDFICPGEDVRCTPGDINGDGVVDNFDINPFVGVLVGADTDPNHICSADANGDGVVDNFDINPFVGILVNGEAVDVGYQGPCDGKNRVWSVNPPAGRCYTVTAAKNGTNSDCPVTVEALDDKKKVVGGAFSLPPGSSAEFCVPALATYLVYRCDATSGHVCRFSWQRLP